MADINLYAIHYIMAPVGPWKVILLLERALSSRDQPSGSFHANWMPSKASAMRGYRAGRRSAAAIFAPPAWRRRLRVA